MTRVVLDSNVFISGMVFGGRPRMILQLGEAGNFHIAISKAIRTEVEQVLLRKFGWSRSMVLSLRSSLWLMAEFVHPRTKVTACDDPDDNRVLECALEAQAQVIVTGDDDLLRLTSYQNIPIVTPVQFLKGKMWKEE